MDPASLPSNPPAPAHELCQRLLRRFHSAIASPLAFAAASSLTVACADGETQCFVVAENACPAPALARARFLLGCNERLLSVDSNGEKDASGACCYEVTIERSEHCPRANPEPVPGRPLRREGQALLADPTQRDDWQSSPPELGVRDLSAEERLAVAAHWTRAGLFEHASVASFQVHALELMALGAPAALVRQAVESALDEVTHATSCFGLASRYAGTPVGPGPLPLSGAPPQLRELEGLATATLLDGCINETLAALDAQHRALGCSVAAVREVLQRIAADEARHAELAWRTAAWAMRALPAAAIERIQARFRDALREHTAPPADAEPALSAAALAHGLISDKDRRQFQREVMRRLVIPCFEQLLASTRAGRAPRAGISSLGPSLNDQVPRQLRHVHAPQQRLEHRVEATGQATREQA